MPSTRRSLPIPPVPVEVYSKLLAELFSNVWNSCDSSDEAAERFGMSYDTVQSWVQHYQAVGIKLKNLPREKDRLAHLILEVSRHVAQSRRRRVRRRQ